jgi:hypothetical protein
MTWFFTVETSLNIVVFMLGDVQLDTAVSGSFTANSKTILWCTCLPFNNVSCLVIINS